jgi:hypothetical protein
VCVCQYRFLIKDDFHDILDHLTIMRDSSLYFIRVRLAIFLAKMELGLSNRVLACLFRLKSK